MTKPLNNSPIPGKAVPNAHQVSEVSLMMGSLLMQGANRFDPVQFRYIEAMARRTLQQHGLVKLLLEKKLTGVLADYQARFEKAQAETAALVARIADQYPDSAEEVQRIFSECDFKGVRRFVAGLEKADHCDSLAELTRYIQHEESDDSLADEHPGSDSFDELLRKQEKDALQSYAKDTSGPVTASQHPFGELKSMRFFRNAWAKLSADKRMAQAIDKPLENAGPLNSHRLVIRSLATMRDISPDYLNRFVSYIDTLLWLEQAGKKIETAVEKVPAGKTKIKGSHRRST